MNIVSPFLSRRGGAQTHHRMRAQVTDVDLDAEAPPSGCAWYESSHELRCGLLVTEHASSATLLDAIPLGWWLDWQTSQRAPSP